MGGRATLQPRPPVHHPPLPIRLVSWAREEREQWERWEMWSDLNLKGGGAKVWCVSGVHMGHTTIYPAPPTPPFSFYVWMYRSTLEGIKVPKASFILFMVFVFFFRLCFFFFLGIINNTYIHTGFSNLEFAHSSLAQFESNDRSAADYGYFLFFLVFFGMTTTLYF